MEHSKTLTRLAKSDPDEVVRDEADLLLSQPETFRELKRRTREQKEAARSGAQSARLQNWRASDGAQASLSDINERIALDSARGPRPPPMSARHGPRGSWNGSGSGSEAARASTPPRRGSNSLPSTPPRRGSNSLPRALPTLAELEV